MIEGRGECVVHMRPPINVDEYGDQQPGTPTTGVTYRVPVWPRMSTESPEVGRSPVVVGLSLALPAGTEVRSRDRFQVRGKTWETIGVGADYRSPFSDRGLVVVDLVLVEG